MKRKPLLLVAAALVLASPMVRAESDLSDEQLNSIRANCVNAQVSLQQIRENDRVTRINRGYLYDSSLKLMSNLNSRVAISNLDAPEMISLTSNFEKKLDEFRASYNSYDDTMKDLVNLSCVEKPVEYSSLLDSARQKRNSLNQFVIDFDAQLDTYQKSINTIKQSLEKKNETSQ